MGKIWEHNECVVLSWDTDNRVTRVRVEKVGEGLKILEAFTSTNGETLASSLSSAAAELNISETHLLLAGIGVSHGISFDLNLPYMSNDDTKQAIIYEIPRHIPCDSQDIIFGYRTVKNDNDNSDSDAMKRTVRVMALPKKEWNEVLTEMSETGIRLDAIVSPFFAAAPLLSDRNEILFPSGEKLYRLVLKEDGISRNIAVEDLDNQLTKSDLNKEIQDYIVELGYTDPLPVEVSSNPANYFQALLIGAYGVSNSFTNDRISIIKLPKELRPERYRIFRKLFFGLLITIGLLIFAFVGRIWWDAKSRYNNLSEEILQIKRKMVLIDHDEKRLKENAKIFKEIKTRKLGNAEIALCLYKIATMLPKGMWLAHFSARDYSIDISLRYSGSGITMPDFNKTGILKVITSSTRSNPRDGTTTVYVRLNYLPPEPRSDKQ